MVKKKRCILKRLMEKNGNISQMQLSGISGVPQTVISRYCRNASSYSIEYLFALKEAFNLNAIDDLFEDDEEE